MKVNTAAVLTGVVVIGALAWSFITGIKEAKKNKDELDKAKADEKYDYDAAQKVNRTLIFDTNAKSDFDADTKSEAYTTLSRLNNKCKDAKTAKEFRIAFDDMTEIRTLYKRNADVELKGYIKSVNKYYDSEPTTKAEASSMISFGSHDFKDLLDTIRTVAALNSGMTNDYYKWRLASRW